MSNHRWCCCGEATDCCDMQSCPAFVTPNTITITYTGSLTRTWSTGQTETLATYTYTIASNSAFTQRGNNCDGVNSPREFGCPTATMTYDIQWGNWLPDTVNENYLTGHVPCGGCDDNFECDLDIVFCNYETQRYYGTSRVVTGTASPFPPGCCQPRTDNTSVIRLLCCDVCGCARPSIFYTPSVTLWTTANDFYTYTPGCCGNSNPALSLPGTWILDRFQIHGKCGCPDATTWAPQNIVGYCSPPSTISVDTIGACGPFDCNGIPSGTIYTDKQTFTWQCESDSGDPFNPTVNFCEVTLSSVTTCNQTMTVVIT